MSDPENHRKSSRVPASPDVQGRRRMLAGLAGLTILMAVVLIVQSTQSPSQSKDVREMIDSTADTSTTVISAATPGPSPDETTTTIEIQRPPRVSIYGDSLAAGFGTSLKSSLERRGVTAFLATKGSSGLSQPGFFDWPNHLDVWVAQEDADVVVIGLGANDCQDVYVDGLSHSVGDPEWSTEYARRVTELIDLVTAQGRTLIWVGTPDAKGKKFRSNLAILRAATRQAIETSRSAEADVVYLDTWNITIGLDGSYSEYVIDPADGERKKARDSDGFHLSSAGNKILGAAITKEIDTALERRGIE